MAATSENIRLLTVFIGSFALARIVVRRILNNSKKRLPELPHLALVGSLPFLGRSEDMPMFFMEKSKSLGNVFAMYLGSRYTIVLNGRQAIYDALVKQSVEFANRPVFYAHSTVMNPQNKGILDRQYSDMFKKYHQLSLSILKQFGFGKNVMENRISLEVEDLILEFRKANGTPIDPDKLLTECVLNVISSIIFGKRYAHNDRELQEVVNNIHLFTVKSIDLTPVSFFPLLRFIPAYGRKIETVKSYQQVMLDFIRRRIDDAVSGTTCDESFAKCFVDEEGSAYDVEELLFLLRDLFLAGTETSTTTLKWAILLLANHPEIQRRLRDEVDSVVPRERLPSLDDRRRLPLVEAAILETWRCKTIVPLSLPHQTISDTTMNGCHVPAGTTVFVNLYSVHMDPAVWDDPSEFRPDRHLDKNGSLVNKDAVMPFSVGRRSCLGELLARQEVFLFFAAIIQNFEILPPEGLETIPFTPVPSITVGPSAFEVRLIPRHLR